jgi:hypothetical protein
MARIAFADESGTHGSTLCYTIGVLSMGKSHVTEFDGRWEESLRSHGVQGEPKWKYIDDSHGLINLLLEWAHTILESPSYAFNAIVVNTRSYKKWSKHGADREAAFYTTYNLLLKHVTKNGGEPTEILIDNRTDSYPKRDEATEVILKRMLLQVESSGKVDNLRKVQSCDVPGVQLADLLTGAINASHLLRINPNTQMKRGKKLAIRRLAEMLGWDDLCYDTWPDSRFNIWHFPPEGFRAQPATRAISLAKAVRYVDAAALAEAS